MKIYYIVKGVVTDPDAHDAHDQPVPLGTTEWQFSDGLPGLRGGSDDYLDLEEGLRALSPAIFHMVPDTRFYPIPDHGGVPHRWIVHDELARKPVDGLFKTRESAQRVADALDRQWRES